MLLLVRHRDVIDLLRDYNPMTRGFSYRDDKIPPNFTKLP